MRLKDSTAFESQEPQWKVPLGWMNCPLLASRHAVVSKTTPRQNKKTCCTHTHLIYKSSFPIACTQGFPCCCFVFFLKPMLCILVLQMKYVFGKTSWSIFLCLILILIKTPWYAKNAPIHPSMNHPIPYELRLQLLSDNNNNLIK